MFCSLLGLISRNAMERRLKSLDIRFLKKRRLYQTGGQSSPPLEIIRHESHDKTGWQIEAAEPPSPIECMHCMACMRVVMDS